MISATEYNRQFNVSDTAENIAAQASTPLHLLVGQSITGSSSFQLYDVILRSSGREDRYRPFEVAANDKVRLAELIKEFRRNPKIATLMITDPFKQCISGYLDTLTERAENIGAVNFVTKQASKLCGDNLDGLAFAEGLEKLENISLSDCSVLFFGCGGVTSAVARTVLNDVKAIGLVDIDITRAEALRERLYRLLPTLKVDIISGVRDFASYDVMYNGTGLGKAAKVGLSPLLDTDCTFANLFIDANYRPSQTRFLEQGSARGAKTINGLSHMLASSAFHCSMITGCDISIKDVAEIYRQLDRIVDGHHPNSRRGPAGYPILRT